MKDLLLALSTLILIVSCSQKEPVAVNPVEVNEDSDWIKLEIPTGREAFSIAGDIDKTLLVSTLEKAYYSTDHGKSWLESKNFQGPIFGMLTRNDTTFALQTHTTDLNGNAGAWDPLYFTPDYGKTWVFYFEHYKQYMDDILPIGSVISNDGARYFIRQHGTPTAPGSAISTINPSEIRRIDKKGEQQVYFPFKHKLTNLYLDPQNRLYVAASGGTYVPESNSFFCCTPDTPGVVYVSKVPLP